MKILQIVESAYRATLEEQDDTVVWLSHAMKNNGAEVNILLKNNAVNYAVKPKGTVPGLPTPGVDHPPQFAEDLQKIQAKGVAVYVWEPDLNKRGISVDSLIQGARPIAENDLGALLQEHDYVFHW